MIELSDFSIHHIFKVKQYKNTSIGNFVYEKLEFRVSFFINLGCPPDLG